MRQGLKPKTGPRDRKLNTYKDRIYFSMEQPDFAPVNQHILVHQVAGLPRGEHFIVIKFDTRRFRKFNLYYDEESALGNFVWTATHIPPQALSVVYRSEDDPEMAAEIES